MILIIASVKIPFSWSFPDIRKSINIFAKIIDNYKIPD